MATVQQLAREFAEDMRRAKEQSKLQVIDRLPLIRYKQGRLTKRAIPMVKYASGWYPAPYEDVIRAENEQHAAIKTLKNENEKLRSQIGQALNILREYREAAGQQPLDLTGADRSERELNELAIKHLAQSLQDALNRAPNIEATIQKIDTTELWHKERQYKFVIHVEETKPRQIFPGDNDNEK